MYQRRLPRQVKSIGQAVEFAQGGTKAANAHAQLMDVIGVDVIRLEVIRVSAGGGNFAEVAARIDRHQDIARPAVRQKREPRKKTPGCLWGRHYRSGHASIVSINARSAGRTAFASESSNANGGVSIM